jgi:hypothetical protein
MSLPPVETGNLSPHPTVVTVTIDQQEHPLSFEYWYPAAFQAEESQYWRKPRSELSAELLLETRSLLSVPSKLD